MEEDTESQILFQGEAFAYSDNPDNIYRLDPAYILRDIHAGRMLATFCEDSKAQGPPIRNNYIDEWPPRTLYQLHTWGHYQICIQMVTEQWGPMLHLSSNQMLFRGDRIPYNHSFRHAHERMDVCLRHNYGTLFYLQSISLQKETKNRRTFHGAPTFNSLSFKIHGGIYFYKHSLEIFFGKNQPPPIEIIGEKELHNRMPHYRMDEDLVQVQHDHLEDFLFE